MSHGGYICWKGGFINCGISIVKGEASWYGEGDGIVHWLVLWECGTWKVVLFLKLVLSMNVDLKYLWCVSMIRIELLFEISIARSKDTAVIPCAKWSRFPANVTAIFPPLFPTFLDSNPSNRSSLVSVILAHVSRVIIKIGLCGEWRVTKSRFNLDHFQLRNRIMNHPAK